MVTAIERRAHPRVDFFAQVQLSAGGDVHLLSARDISKSGVFLQAASAAVAQVTPGTEVELLVFAADDIATEFSCRATVIRVDGGAPPDRPAGLGVTFINLDASAERQLDAFIGAINGDLTPSLEEKLAALQTLLRQMESVLVCFSAGVDSTFLLNVAVDTLGSQAVALTAQSPSLPQRELAQAVELAAAIGARHIVRSTDELSDQRYAANPPDRCYFCKQALLALATAVQQETGTQVILLGTNADDLSDFRPGLTAAKECRTRQPLAEVGMTKADIRRLSRALGLPTWEKPELACLASRVPYGTTITEQRLRQIERFEDALLDLGFSGMRVRYHQDVARIELQEADLPRAVTPQNRNAILRVGRELGFSYITVDLAGYRRGALNEVLSDTARQQATTRAGPPSS